MLYQICFIRYALSDMLYPICCIRYALSDMLFECMLMTTPCICSWGSHAHMRTHRLTFFKKLRTIELTDGVTSSLLELLIAAKKTLIMGEIGSGFSTFLFHLFWSKQKYLERTNGSHLTNEWVNVWGGGD